MLRAARVTACAVWLAQAAAAQPGIAGSHPGDRGIASDPRVLFVEDFESGTVADLASRWSDVRNPEGMALESAVPPGSPGHRSLRIRARPAAATGGHLYRVFDPPVERLHLRYYAAYHEGKFHHVGGYLGGYAPPTDWPQGGAGERPRGDDRFSVGAEPVSRDLRFDLYTYWMGMRGLPNGKAWGNTFLNREKIQLEPTRCPRSPMPERTRTNSNLFSERYKMKEPTVLNRAQVGDAFP